MEAEHAGRRLVEALASALESTAFVMTEPRPDGGCWEGEVLHAEIALGAGWHGRLALATTRGTGIRVAAGMLGLEEGEPEVEDSAPGAIAELLNIVAGSFVEDLAEPGVARTVGLPVVSLEVADSIAERWAAPWCSAHLMDDEGGRIEAALWLHGSVEVQR
jgi:CheY-specific phosphatase CheX